MSRLSKIICLIALCSFTFTTSAANILCCLELSDKADTQQNIIDSTAKACHSDDSSSSDVSLDDCCLDMNSCGSSISFVPSGSLTQLQIAKASVLLPSNEFIVFNTSSPPERPPKSIN